MGLVIGKTGSDFMSGENENVMADYDGLVRLASLNLFPDPGLREWDEATGWHRYLTLAAPPSPTHWAPYIRDENKVKNSARQVLAPLPLEAHVYDQEDELVNGPSPVDAIRAVAIAPPVEPDAKAFMVNDVTGLPEGWYCIAWGLIPDDDWQKNDADMTNPGPRSEPFFLAQGQGFLVSPPTELGSNIIAVALWITEPKNNANATIAQQQALLSPMFVIDRWRVRGINDFVRVVGPFNRRVPEQVVLPERRNLTFVGKAGDMPKLRTFKDHVHNRHDEHIRCQVAYAFRTESGIGEVKRDPGWKHMPPGREILRFVPTDFEVRRDNEETNKERKSEREASGKVDETNEDRNLETDTTDTRGREKEKKPTQRIKGWVPIVRFKITDDPNNPDEEHGTTEWYMIVDKGKQSGFKDKNEKAEVVAGGPDTWPKHNTELRLINITDSDMSGVTEPTEAPEAPSEAMILDLDTSGLTPGKHWVKTSLFVVDGDDERETLTSEETKVDIDIGEGIRVQRPKWHNLLDNDDLSEQDLEDYNLPRGWDIPRPFPSGVIVRNPERGGIIYEDNSNASGTYAAFRSPVATLRASTNHYLLRFKVSLGRHANGKLQAVLEEYDMVDGVPQLINARVIRGWHTRVDDKFFEFRLSKNQNDPNNKRVMRMDEDTKEIRVRFEGVGNTNLGNRNLDVEVSHWGVFRGWGRPRKSKRLDVKRAERVEPKDTVYPHGGYCVIVENPLDTNPINPAYTPMYSQNFEAGATGLSFSNTGATVGSRHGDYAIHGEYGYRTAKTTTGATASYIATHTLASPVNNVGIGVDFFIQSLSAHAVNMLFARRADASQVAKVGVNSSSAVVLETRNASGTLVTHTSTTKLEAGDLGRLELVVEGMNTASATFKVYLRVGDGERIEVLNVTGINQTGIQIAIVRFGGEDSNNSALWDFYYDNLDIADVSVDDPTSYEYQPGNQIEYYGPYETPLSEQYGPYGARIPVKGGEEYTLAANISGMDLTPGTEIFRWRVRGSDHKILQTFDPLATGLSGDVAWFRPTSTQTMPVAAAYVEIFGNRLGAGTLWIHGIQFEKGGTATAYTDKNELSGYDSVFFSTIPHGIAGKDPMTPLAEVTAIRDIATAITDDEETSYSIQYRSGNALNAMGSYTGLVENLNKDHTIIEVKVNMTSTSDTNSPELRRIEVDLARPYSHLLRADGSEFEGGVLVNNIGAEHPTRNVEKVQFASGRTGNQVLGTVVNRRIGMSLEAFRPHVVAEIANSYGEEPLRLQTPYGRYTLELEEIPAFETNPLTRIYLDEDRLTFWQRYTATITATIEAEELF